MRRIGWLSGAAGRSVTEMEILHGVLADPSAAGHAYFYLRDPSYLSAVPDGVRAELVDDDQSMAARLSDLRGRIQASALPSGPTTIRRTSAGRCSRTWRSSSIGCSPRTRHRTGCPRTLGTGGQRQGQGRTGLPASDLAATVTGYLETAAAGPRCPPGTRGFARIRGRRRGGAGRRHCVDKHPSGSRRDPARRQRRAGGRRPGRDAQTADRRTRRAGETHTDPDGLPCDQLALRGLLASDGAGKPSDGIGHRTPGIVERGAGAPDLTLLPDRLPAAVRIVVATRSARTAQAASARGWTCATVPDLNEDQRRTYVTG